MGLRVQGSGDSRIMSSGRYGGGSVPTFCWSIRSADEWTARPRSRRFASYPRKYPQCDRQADRGQGQRFGGDPDAVRARFPGLSR